MSFLQEFSICGPQSEICVANQTIQDDTCLVPCSGLYADVWDDSRVNHRVMAGTVRQILFVEDFCVGVENLYVTLIDSFLNLSNL